MLKRSLKVGKVVRNCVSGNLGRIVTVYLNDDKYVTVTRRLGNRANGRRIRVDWAISNLTQAPQYCSLP